MNNNQNSKNLVVDVVFENGKRRRVVITSSVMALVKRAAMVMPHLFEGTGFNPLNADVSDIVAITRADHDILRQVGRPERQACFRLGQMDMQASVCDMLRAMAKKTDGKTCCMMRFAADLVESMEVPVANT